VGKNGLIRKTIVADGAAEGIREGNRSLRSHKLPRDQGILWVGSTLILPHALPPRSLLPASPMNTERFHLPLLFTVGFIWAVNFASTAYGETGPSVTESLDNLVTHEGVEIRIAAHEPNVVDPVAARFDDRGRMWVVEMRDYPTGPIDGESFNGQIAILSDEDGDHVFEKRVTFADALVFPTGLQPWHDGVIVTLAGRIEFMADRDDDGRCDHREVWFEGFETDNEQLRANHPTLGPDGRVIVANGLRGGTIRSANERWINADKPVDLRGKDFAFDPRGGFFGVVAGNSQFGMSVDDFGNHVGCSNRNPAIETLFSLAEMADDRWSTPADTLHDIGRPAAESDVRGLIETWTTSHTHAGQFSAACGVTVGMGDAMPTTWRGDLVVCEPTSYAVQRQRVRRSGVGRVSLRIDDPYEFIASKDAWFRPVDTTIGPDGALYVVDMCRAVIEHPAWAPEELKERPDERFGSDRGRIWRVAANDIPSRPATVERPTTIADWVKQLDHSNSVQREFATAHLMRADADAVAAAIHARRDSATESSDAGDARSLWLLQIHNRLTVADIRRSATHRSPEVRRLAIRLLRDGDVLDIDPTESQELARQWITDADEWVRFDAVGLVSSLTRNSVASDETEEFVSNAASEIATMIRSTPMTLVWQRRLTIGSPRLGVALVREILNSPQTADSQSRSLIRLLARRIAFSDADADVGNRFPVSVEDESAVAFAAGWCEGFRAANRKPDNATDAEPSELRWQLLDQAKGSAGVVIADRTLDIQVRLNGLEVLAALDLPREKALRTLVQQPDNETLQSRALVNLLAMSDMPTIEWLSENIASLPPSVRADAIDQSIGSEKNASTLLDWIESERLPMPLLSIGQSDRLRRSSNALVAGRAKELFSAAREDRQSVITEYAASTHGVADLTAGRALFTQHCATCHRIADQGTAVGPDISDSRTKTPVALLTAILDPNAAIDAGFLAYQALTLDGQVLTGALIENNEEQITLQLAGGERSVIDRDELELFQTTGVSLMPDGMERSISPEQMRDLLGYLKGWRYLSETNTTLDLSTTTR